eukprot:gene10419-25196_t
MVLVSYGVSSGGGTIPLGSDTASVIDGVLTISYSRCAGCYSSQLSTPIGEVDGVTAKKRSPSCLGWVGVVFCSFWYGLLLHLLPSEIVTADVTLGSSKMHKTLGAAWALLCTGPWTVVVEVASGAAHNRRYVTFASGSKSQAKKAASILLSLSGGGRGLGGNSIGKDADAVSTSSSTPITAYSDGGVG